MLIDRNCKYIDHTSKIEYNICHKCRIHHQYLLPVNFRLINMLQMKNKMKKIKITSFTVELVIDPVEFCLLESKSLCISSFFLLPLLSEVSSAFFPRYPVLNQAIYLWLYYIPLSQCGIENRLMFIYWGDNVR